MIAQRIGNTYIALMHARPGLSGGYIATGTTFADAMTKVYRRSLIKLSSLTNHIKLCSTTSPAH